MTACVLAAVSGRSARAQSTGAPPGAVRGLFGGTDAPNPARSTQQLSMWFDLGGGYDQNSDVSAEPVGADIEGLATTTVGAIRYWRGRTTRSVEATARLFRNDQRAGRTVATGGEVVLGGQTQLGRRAGLAVTLRGANDSAMLFGTFGPQPPPVAPPALDPEIDVPDVAPPQGIVRDRWYSFGGNATAFRNWTPRHRTSAQYSLVRRRPTTDTGLDSAQQLVHVRHDWMFRMQTGLLGSYRFERVRQEFPDAPDLAPMRTQSLEGGLIWERRFSAIRVLSASAQAGVSRIHADSSVPDADGAYEPTGTLSASYVLTRRWALGANASRGVSFLQGVAPVPFTTDVAALSLTGLFGRRVSLVTSATYSSGDAVGVAAGAFEAVGGSATLRYAFRYGGLFAGYTRYEHTMRDMTPVAGGLALRFEQSSVRAGVTLWLPLLGRF